MSLTEIVPAEALQRPVAYENGATCPFDHKSEAFRDWLVDGLQCAAGKREFRLGRYHVATFTNGHEYARALSAFRTCVAEHRKTGFLAIFNHGQRCDTAEDELRLLGAAMAEAGLTSDSDALIAGRTLSHSVELPCPVLGEETVYEFFSVAFTRNAGNPHDPLYDPSLSAPFTAINTTSDAFAFARLVADQAMRAWGRPVHEMTHDRDAVELLFRRCVTAWQNMSITTITNYSRGACISARTAPAGSRRTTTRCSPN
jgi:hypothetical protein